MAGTLHPARALRIAALDLAREANRGPRWQVRSEAPGERVEPADHLRGERSFAGSRDARQSGTRRRGAPRHSDRPVNGRRSERCRTQYPAPIVRSSKGVPAWSTAARENHLRAAESAAVLSPNRACEEGAPRAVAARA